MTWITDALAAYRLTRLVTKDTITEGLRFKVQRAAMNADVEDGIAAKLQTLTSCAWCVSWWCALGVVAVRKLAPDLWEPVAKALAFSAVTGLIAENLD